MLNLSKLSKVVAVAALLGVAQLGYAQQKLTILWAQWDPANYLQELVEDYEKAAGVKVVVETTPWPDFQNKAFKEFTAKGSAYDMVVGDSQWIGAGSTGGHYVDLSDFFKKNKLTEVMAPATVKGYAEYPGNSGKYWAVPLEGDANGFAYRKDWFEDPKETAAFKAKYKYDLAVPKTWKELGDIAEFFHRPKEKRYGLTIYTDNGYDALVMGVENVIFSFGADLGDFSTCKVQGMINSKESIEALNFYKKLYGYTPPDWGKTFFQEANQAMTEGLVAMSMNYFAFFPALANPATNKFAKQTGYFAMPKGPSGKQFAALGGQGISVVSYSKNKDASMKFLEWFIREDVQKKWAQLGGYACNAAILKSNEFRKATPYNEAFYQSMFMVKDFWAVPEYAELLTAANKRWHPFVVGGKGSAQEAQNGLAKDWEAKVSAGSPGDYHGVVAVINHEFAPRLVGEDPRNITRIWENLYSGTRGHYAITRGHVFPAFSRRGVSISALSGIDIALWDILGKSLGAPVWQLLGGRRAERMPAYASGGWADAALIGEQLTSYVAKGRFGAVKMRIGVFDGSPRASARRVLAAREALGPEIDLMVDAHGTFTVSEARQFCHLVRDCDIAWFEEPVTAADKAGLAEVRRGTHIPIASGVSDCTRFDFRELIDLRAADILQPDLAICGGITEGMRIAALAGAANLRLAPHLWAGAPAFAAGMHVAAACPCAHILEYSLGANPMIHELVEESFAVENGTLAIPDRPGLGITIRDDFVARYRRH